MIFFVTDWSTQIGFAVINEAHIQVSLNILLLKITVVVAGSAVIM